MIKYPQIGCTKTIPIDIYTHDEQGNPKDKLGEIKVTCKLLGTDKTRELHALLSKARVDELNRVVALRKSTNKDQAPELWDPKFETPESAKAFRDIQRKTLTDCLVSVEGIVVGEQDLGDERDVNKLITTLEAIGLATTVWLPVLKAQSPEPENFLSQEP